MYPKQHIILGVLFALILFFIFPQIGVAGIFIIFLSSVLIDVDHYLYYVYKKKDWNLKKAYIWNLKLGKKYCSLSKLQRHKTHDVFCILHGIEILILLFFLSFFSKYFLFILTGFSFHLLADVIYDTKKINKTTSKFSLIKNLFRNKKTIFIEEFKIK